MQKISCIICAYNEAPRIGAVLTVAAHHPFIHQLIVVDDGSTDATAEAVRRFPGVRLVPHSSNRGKSAAIATGVSHATHDLLLFLDADLTGLTAHDVSALAEPVLSGHADMTISLRKNSLLVHKLIGLDFTSGERVFHKRLLEGKIDAIARLPRFGVETYLNELAIREHLRIAVIKWPGVSHVRKTAKSGVWRGLMNEAKMILDISRTLSPLFILRQNYRLLSLIKAKR